MLRCIRLLKEIAELRAQNKALLKKNIELRDRLSQLSTKGEFDNVGRDTSQSR